MIVLTSPDGRRFGINPDLIVRLEAGPTTALEMPAGDRVEAAEGIDEIVAAVREFRASVLAVADHLEIQRHPSNGQVISLGTDRHLRLV